MNQLLHGLFLCCMLLQDMTTMVQAGTPVTSSNVAHCPRTSSGTFPNLQTSDPTEVQCSAATTGSLAFAYVCLGSNMFPDYKQCKAPSSTGPAICLYNGVDDKCTVARSGSSRFLGIQFRCWEGHEAASSLKCTKCKQGKFRGNTGGLHRVDVEHVFCVQCLAGKYASQEGLMQCDNCQLGRYSTGACAKEDSDGGPSGGCISCKECPVGQYQDQTASSSCIPCVAGKYGSESAAGSETDCQVCPDGEYSTNAGSSNCDFCPTGYATSGSTTSAPDHAGCKACTAGQYSSEKGRALCTDCEVGRYSDSGVQNPECKTCDDGQETNKGSLVGGSSCRDCIKGQYENDHQCEACPIGWNQILNKKIFCDECVVGRIAASTQTLTDCAVCHNGEYNDEVGGSSCKTCGTGTFSKSDNLAHPSCSSCPMGYKSSSPSSATCSICASRKYQDEMGASLCKDCDLGRYSDQQGLTLCTKCGEGTTAPNNDASFSYADQVGQLACKLCTALGSGHVATSSKTDCTTCARTASSQEFLDNTNT